MVTIIGGKQVSFHEENILIKNTERGFRIKRSCLTNILDILDIYNDVFKKRFIEQKIQLQSNQDSLVSWSEM